LLLEVARGSITPEFKLGDDMDDALPSGCSTVEPPFSLPALSFDGIEGTSEERLDSTSPLSRATTSIDIDADLRLL
jgi:hypothetical protein